MITQTFRDARRLVPVHARSGMIAERCYASHSSVGIDATLDGRHIANPGYDRDHDREPADVLAPLLHGAF